MSEDKVPYGAEGEKWMRDAQELRALLESAGYTQIAAAKELDMSERQLREQCSGRVPVPRVVIYAMNWLANRKPNQERWLQVHWKRIGLTVSRDDKFEYELKPDGMLYLAVNGQKVLHGPLDAQVAQGIVSIHSSYSSDRLPLIETQPKPAGFPTKVNRDMPTR